MCTTRVIQLMTPTMPSIFKLQSKFIQIDKVFDLVEQAFMHIRINGITHNGFSISDYKEAVTKYIKEKYNYEIGDKFDRMLVNMRMASDVNIYYSQIKMLVKSTAFASVIVQVIKSNFSDCDIILPRNMKDYGACLASNKNQGIKYVGIYSKVKDRNSIKSFDEIIKI